MKTIFDQALYLPMRKSRPGDLLKKNSITSAFTTFIFFKIAYKTETE